MQGRDRSTLGFHTDPPAVMGSAVVGDPLRVIGSLAFLSAELQGAAVQPERDVADDTEFTVAVSATFLHTNHPCRLYWYTCTSAAETPFGSRRWVGRN